MAKQGTYYVAVGLVTGVAGLGWALWGERSDVMYGTVEGISVFAVIYLVAQSSERVVEFLVGGLSLLENSPEQKKKEALTKLRRADSTLNGNPTSANFDVVATADRKVEAKEEADANRKDIAFLAGGLSLLLCATGVNALNYGLLDHIGAEGVNSRVDYLLTTLAAAGGTKALHELIGRFQKGKEKAEEE